MLRKFRQEERKIRHQEYHNNKTFFSQLGLEKRQQDIDATTSIWTQQCGGDLIGSGKVDEAEVEPEGYNRFLLTDDISTAKLWDTLSTSNSSKVCIDFLDENCESSASTVCLPVLACPPTILSVRTFENFGANVFVGVPLVVNVEIAHATRAVVTWFLDRTAVCHDAYVYTPRIDDIGKTLALLIVPVRPGHTGENGEGSEAYQFLKKVEELPSMPLVSPLRDAWLGDNLPRQHLRVMTYNLLADTYASRVMDQTVMYNHCPVKYLSMQRRMPMLLFELLSFQPDIICLQEVDREAYKSLFEPVFESQGYQGFYSNKACIQQQEGCAMFWSLRTFQRDSLVYQYYLKDLFQEQKNHHPEGWDSHHGIDRLLHENGELNLIATKKVGQVLQLAELRLLSPGDNKPDRVLVGNTHLFYHPLADHVRTLQAYTVCCQMDIVRRRNGRPCPLIFCGDLNSGPLSGAVQLLVLRSVGPDNHETWKHLRDYEWTMGGEDYLLEHEYIGNNVATGDLLYQVEAFEDAVQIFSDDDANEEPERTKESHTPPFIQLPSTFPRLISGFPNLPEFTNYAIDFSETLDYILVSEPSLSEPFGLLPYRAAPMPTSDFVRQYVAMPNEHMPSDHVSLICDLEWEHYDLRSLSPHARDRSRRLDEMENL